MNELTILLNQNLQKSIKKEVAKNEGWNSFRDILGQMNGIVNTICK